jgi:hypothetical protein
MGDEPVNRVSVTDLDMPFLSMVRFMVKWAIAAIPALLILTVLGAVFWGVFLGFFVGVGSGLWHKSAKTTVALTPASKTGAIATKNDTKPPGDAAVAAYISKLSIKNVRVAKSYLGDIGVFGEVKNNGDRTLKKVELTIYCLDGAGKPIFEKQYHPVLVSDMSFGNDNQPLKPGYSRQFGVKMSDAPSDWTQKVDVKVASIVFE